MLTATQATIWSLYRAVVLSPTAPDAGPLSRRVCDDNDAEPAIEIAGSRSAAARR